MELSIQAMKLVLKEKGRIFYFNTFGIAKIGKRSYMAILINTKFTCHVHSVLILDIFM
jgi:hypothetical protein